MKKVKLVKKIFVIHFHADILGIVCKKPLYVKKTFMNSNNNAHRINIIHFITRSIDLKKKMKKSEMVNKL